MKQSKIFLLLGLFWLIIIGGFIGFKEFTLRSGQEILLKTRPVDPRDLFRGDYVTLSYDISRVEVGNNNFNIGDKVYVGLITQGDYMVASGAYSTPPSDKFFIKGTVRRVSEDLIQVEYGIESYFVPEGKGKQIERQLGKSVAVKAAVDKSGTAIIRTLLIDGQAVKF